ncbi:MAG: hypothetical protein WBR13_02295 [Allosphingosinicella sp.]
MKPDRPCHDQDEIRRALGRIGKPEALRLMQLARNWVRRAPRRSAEDLLNEAFDRMLVGRRPWPVDLPLPHFLSGVMRSIVSDWACEDARQPLLDDEGWQDDPSTLQPAAQDVSDLLERMQEHLADDAPAQALFANLRAGLPRREVAAALRMSDQDYDTVRRRMIRKLLRSFGPEWIEENDRSN